MPHLVLDQQARILRRCATLRNRPAAVRDLLYRLTVVFVANEGAKWIGCSSNRDFVTNRLGAKSSSFASWLHQGILLSRNPSIRQLFLNGLLSDSALKELSHSLDDGAIETLLPELPRIKVLALRRRIRELQDSTQPDALPPTPSESDERSEQTHPSPAGGRIPDPLDDDPSGWLRIPAPRKLGTYFRETMRIAEAQIGVDCSDDPKIEAVLAENADEIDITITDAEAATRFAEKAPLKRFRRKRQLSPSLAAMHLGTLNDAAAVVQSRLDGARVEFGSGDPGLHIGLLPTAKRKRAVFLLRAMKRALRTMARLKTANDDALLELFDEDAHGRLGYRNFEVFAEEQLGIAPSTAFECLKRARALRHRDPVVVAYRRGRINQLQTYLLLQLYRKGVPRSCMQRWIDETERLTVQALRDRIQWVCDQVDRDYRSWLLKDCPPPTDDELRISKRSLREIAENPNPEALDQLFDGRRIPMTTLEWSVRKETADYMYQIMASIQDKHYAEHHVMLEPWMALLLIFHRARMAWRHLPKANQSKWERVYDRDEYRCSVPGCSRRRSVQDHHIVFRSKQGGDEHINQITICDIHHRMAHEEKIIRITGISENGKDSLLFELGIDQNGANPVAVYLGDRLVGGWEYDFQKSSRS